MKNLVLTVALFPLFAKACPDLSGFYPTCLENADSDMRMDMKDVAIAQKMVADVALYRFSSTDLETQEREIEVYVADGKIVEDAAEGDTRSARKSFCRGDELVVQIASVHDMGIAGMEVVSSKKDGKLFMHMTSKVLGIEAKSSVICQ